MAKWDFTHEVLEPIAVAGVCAADLRIAVDRLDTFDRPAESRGMFAWRFVAARTMAVLSLRA